MPCVSVVSCVSCVSCVSFVSRVSCVSFVSVVSSVSCVSVVFCVSVYSCAVVSRFSEVSCVSTVSWSLLSLVFIIFPNLFFSLTEIIFVCMFFFIKSVGVRDRVREGLIGNVCLLKTFKNIYNTKKHNTPMFNHCNAVNI